MHLVNTIPPYLSSVDAIAKFPETATALGVKLDEHNMLRLAAPHGINDVIHMEVKPTDYFKANEERLLVYKKRIAKKNWQANWHKLKIHHV